MVISAPMALAGNEAELEVEVGAYGAGDLRVLSFEATEGLSETFEVTATLAPAPHVDVAADELVGSRACVRIQLGGGDERWWDGIVSRVRAWGEGAGEVRRRLRITVVPALWLLSKVVRSRIFQDLSVPEIVKQVLDEGSVPFRQALSGSYAKRVYCVQYNESDLAFVSRLLEDEGIFWFFEHEQARHTLVLADSAAACPVLGGDGRLPFVEASRTVAGADHVDGFSSRLELSTGAFTVRDYDPGRPTLDLTRSVDAGTFEGELELYDHPSGSLDLAEAKARATRRLEAERARATLQRASGPSRRISAGATFTLEQHPLAELDGEYLVVRAWHRGEQREALGGIGTPGPAAGEPYRSDFVCLRKDVPFRPPRCTPRPIIPGAQTALVVGPSGEEIFTDEAGRIKVQFHWDREGRRDERASCWVRVAQAWAGPGWGALYLPRVGHEVVVEFLEGDPDRPVVTGSVYNGAHPPPIALPAEKTKSTLRTASSPGSLGSNELRFEDADGQEEVYLHAQKDLSAVVENDRTEQVKNDEALAVTSDRSRRIGRDQARQIGRDDSTVVEHDQLLEVTGNRSVTVGGSHHESVALDESIAVSGARAIRVATVATESVGLAKTLTVGGAYAVTVGGAMNELVAALKTEEVGGSKVERIGVTKAETVIGSRTLEVGGDLSETVAKERTLRVDGDLVESIGGGLRKTVGKTYTLKAKDVLLAAQDQLTIKVGAATLQVKAGGEVTIRGPSIQVTASGPLTIAGSKVSEN